MFSISSTSRMLSRRTISPLISTSKIACTSKFPTQLPLKYNNLFRTFPSSHFCSNPKDDTPKINGLTFSEFAECIKQKTSSTIVNHDYSSNIIYAASHYNKRDPIHIAYSAGALHRNTILTTGFWSAIGFILYLIYPWSSVLAVVFGYQELLKIRNRQELLAKTVERMDLINDKQVEVFTNSLKGKSILCNIEGAKVTYVQAKENNGKPEEKKNDLMSLALEYGKNLKENKEKEGVPVEVVFLDSVEYKAVSVVFDFKPDNAIENIDLLKSIINGNVEEVKKFNLKLEEKEEDAQEETNQQQ